MNLRKRFSRWAAGLGIAAAAAVPAAAEPVVPPGSNPVYLNKVYEKMLANSQRPDFSQVSISSSVTDFAALPDNEWLHRLKALSPEDAESAVQGCIANLCEHKYLFLNEQETHIARILVLEAAFNNGLNDQEFRAYSTFLGRFQPDRAFQQQDETVIEQVADSLVRSSAYRNLKQALLPAAQINAANASEQFRIRRDFIAYLTRTLREAMNYDTIPTYLDRFPGTMNGTAAVSLPRNYIPELVGNRALLFNYMASNTHDIEELVKLTGHEVRHSVDFDDVEKVKSRAIESNDPRFSHLAAINLNNNLYIPLCATQSYGSVSCPEQYQWYNNQYVERSAVGFGQKLLEKFREKLRTAEPARISGRFEAEKFELPS